METVSKFIVPGILFLLTLAFGVGLSLAGRPYHGLLFNVHKLIALGAVIAAAFQFSKMLKGGDSLAFVVPLLVLAGLGVVALFASGAFMSLEKLDYGLLLAVHRLAPVLVAVAVGLAVYLLGRGKP